MAAGSGESFLDVGSSIRQYTLPRGLRELHGGPVSPT